MPKTIAAAALGLVAAMAAGEQAYSILQPQMKVEIGSFTAPAAKLGEIPAQAWSATTYGAAIDGKPNPGTVTTVRGEIVDFSCYLEVGKHGEKHRGCAQRCLANGQPIGLLTQNGNLYMLMEEEHDPRRDGLTNFREAAIVAVGKIVDVSGVETAHAGYKAIYVGGFLKK